MEPLKKMFLQNHLKLAVEKPVADAHRNREIQRRVDKVGAYLSKELQIPADRITVFSGTGNDFRVKVTE